MITIEHIKSGQRDTITKDDWNTICANGFQADFKIIANPEVPDEVKKAISKPTKSESGLLVEQ